MYTRKTWKKSRKYHGILSVWKSLFSLIHCQKRVDHLSSILFPFDTPFVREVAFASAASSPPNMDTVGASSCHDSLIFMSTHKATAARCLSRHAVRVAPLRRLALSVLFTTTIATTSYQTTCTVSETTFNKRQHANARSRVESLSRLTHYDMVAARTQP